MYIKRFITIKSNRVLQQLKYSVVFLFLCSPFYLSAQTTLKAFIFSRKKEPLPLTNIVSVHWKNGTMTDDKGQFIFSNVQSTDTLKISNISYRSLLIPVHSINNNDTVFMEENVNKLNDVIVKNRNLSIFKTEKKLGNFAYSKHGEFVLDPGVEVAVFIHNPLHENALINEFYFGLKHKSDKKTNIRIRLFEINETTGEPGDDLLTENIIIKYDQLRFKNYIDLSKYKIFLPLSGLIAAVEFITLDNITTTQDRTSVSANLNNNTNSVWLNYRDKKWSHNNIPAQADGMFMTPDIGLIVLYPGN
jgi:hypothetical protein